MTDKNHDPMAIGNFIEPGSRGGWAKCHEKHPILKVLNGEVRGANCSYPAPGFDIYIGLDHTMADMRPYPWCDTGAGVLDIHFPILDGQAPKDAGEFKAMVGWLCSQLQAGKRVHIGCIGGHGRTGLLLAALLAVNGDPDAIQTVRAIHCQKAIETKAQIDFLVQHFGVKPAAPRYGAAAPQPAFKSGYKTSTTKAKQGSPPVSGHAYKPFVGSKTIW